MPSDTNNGELFPYTWPANSEKHKNRTPFKIDYIFTSKNVKILSADVIETRASDHKPIVCEIEI